MADFLWPVDIVPASQTWKILDPAGQFQSPLSGAVRTVARAGARLSCTITVPPVKGADRARVMAVLSGLRGRSNRIWMPDFTTTQRGAISCPELISNNTFAAGSTNWAGFTVLDGVARINYYGNSPSGAGFSPSSMSSVTQYAPHSIRFFMSDGSAAWGGGDIRAASAVGGASDYYVQTFSNGAGLKSGAFVPYATTACPGFADYSATRVAGDSLDIRWSSFARCALVDNGVNGLTYSDAADNAAWVKVAASVVTTTATAPDGSSSARSLDENLATSAHYIVQNGTCSTLAQDIFYGVALKASARSFAWLQLLENTGSTGANCYFNLSAGTVGTPSASGNWSNLRTGITSMGNGWFFCWIVARKTNAATLISHYVGSAAADGTPSYAGTSVQSILVWRATSSISVINPAGSRTAARLTPTTSTVTAGTAQTGSRMYLKGLPASTSGLLRVGDPVQIGNQLNFCTAQLDSDAAGLGVLQVGLPWRVSPADNDPVIFNRPMAKMLVANDIEWDTTPGQFSGFQLELVEDVT